MAAAGENPTDAYCAGEMGRNVCVARRQQAPLPFAYASGFARPSFLRGRDTDYCRFATGVHAVPHPNLARQGGKNASCGRLSKCRWTCSLHAHLTSPATILLQPHLLEVRCLLRGWAERTQTEFQPSPSGHTLVMTVCLQNYDRRVAPGY